MCGFTPGGQEERFRAVTVTMVRPPMRASCGAHTSTTFGIFGKRLYFGPSHLQRSEDRRSRLPVADMYHVVPFSEATPMMCTSGCCFLLHFGVTWKGEGNQDQVSWRSRTHCKGGTRDGDGCALAGEVRTGPPRRGRRAQDFMPGGTGGLSSSDPCANFRRDGGDSCRGGCESESAGLTSFRVGGKCTAGATQASNFAKSVGGKKATPGPPKRKVTGPNTSEGIHQYSRQVQELRR